MKVIRRMVRFVLSDETSEKLRLVAQKINYDPDELVEFWCDVALEQIRAENANLN